MKIMPFITRIRIADSTTLIHIRSSELPQTPGLTQAERVLVQNEIDKRFGQLNAAAVGQLKPRWT